MSALAKKSRPIMQNRTAEMMGSSLPAQDTPRARTKARPAARWYRFDVDRWNAMTRNLDPIEAIVLLTIMNECHERREPYPVDPARLAKRCKTTKPAMARAIRTLLQERLIVPRGAGYWSDYIEDEITNQRKREEQASQNVSERWRKTQQKQRQADTSVTKSSRVLEEGEDRGDNPPLSRSPSPSSSTRDDSRRSMIKGRAPDGAPSDHRDPEPGDVITIEGMARCRGSHPIKAASSSPRPKGHFAACAATIAGT